MAVERDYLTKGAVVWRSWIERHGTVLEIPYIARGEVTGGGKVQVIVTWQNIDHDGKPLEPYVDRTSYYRMAREVFASEKAAVREAADRLAAIERLATERAKTARHAGYHIAERLQSLSLEPEPPGCTPTA